MSKEIAEFHVQACIQSGIDSYSTDEDVLELAENYLALEAENERLRELLNRAHQLLRCTKGYKATSLFDDVSKALRGEEE